MSANSDALSAGLRVAVVGTGRMGANMARRLKDCGIQVVAVSDRDRALADGIASEIGALVPETLSAVTAAADVVITVVSDDAAMLEIFGESPDSLLEGASGKLFVNCATVSPAVHREVERRVEARGGSSLEASMASSIVQAREGTLYLMCAGRPAAYDRAKPLLGLLSSAMRYVGEAGRAGQVKALVNMVMNMNTAALAEGLGLADALGLNLGMVREVFSQTGASSRVLMTDGEDMEKRDHACFFSAAHAAKDSGIALSLAKEAGLDLPLAAATLGQYSKMVDAGLGELDKSGIAELTFKARFAAGR
jgi:3-hydroxyisobutyrate dehydrogenase